MSFGLHEILKTTAANIHTTEEWSIIFSILEYVGAGKIPVILLNGPPPLSTSMSTPAASQNKLPSIKLAGDVLFPPGQLHHSLSQDPILVSGAMPGKKPAGGYWSSSDDRGYTSDSELEVAKSSVSEIRTGSPQNVSPAQSWILLTTQEEGQGNSSDANSVSKTNIADGQQPTGPQKQPMERQLFFPDPKALMKSCETLSFLVRDAAHITPDNFTLCVTTIRSYVEASTYKVIGGKNAGMQAASKKRGRTKHRGHSHDQLMPKSKSFSGAQHGNSAYDADYESDSEMDKSAASQQVCVQVMYFVT